MSTFSGIILDTQVKRIQEKYAGKVLSSVTLILNRNEPIFSIQGLTVRVSNTLSIPLNV